MGGVPRRLRWLGMTRVLEIGPLYFVLPSVRCDRVHQGAAVSSPPAIGDVHGGDAVHPPSQTRRQSDAATAFWV